MFGTTPLTYRLQQGIPSQSGSPAVVLLHGIGSHEGDLFALAPYFPPQFYVVSVRGPYDYGWGGYSWFDLQITTQGLWVNTQMAAHSRQALAELRQDLLNRYRLDPQRLYLLGFSQGAMLALSLLLHQPHNWAGVVAMSGALLPELCPQPRDPDAVGGKPIVLIHGEQDQVVPLLYAEMSRDYLQDYNLSYYTYRMGHEVSAASLERVITTLKTWAGLD